MSSGVPVRPTGAVNMRAAEASSTPRRTEPPNQALPGAFASAAQEARSFTRSADGDPGSAV